MGALVLLSAAPADAIPTLSGLEVRPGHMSPNGDGINDSVTLSFVPGADAESLEVSVTIEDASSALVATLIAGETRAADSTVTATWDPGPIADGDYSFEILLVEGADSLAQSAIFVSDVDAPTIAFGAIAPNPFDPNQAPPDDVLTILVTVTGGLDDRTTVSIINSLGVVTEELGTFAGVGEPTFTWDGRNASDVTEAEGVYTVRATVADLAGNSATEERTVVLDTEGPTFADAGGDFSEVLTQTGTFPVSLTGMVSDLDVVTAIEVSFDAGSTFVAADSTSPALPGNDVFFRVDVDDAAPEPSIRNVRVRATDDANHSTTRIYRVAYDSPLPTVISSSIVSGATIADGETIEVVTTWNRDDLIVSADFLTLDSGYTIGAETVSNEGGGTYRITYRISATNSVEPGNKVVTLSGASEFVTGTDLIGLELLSVDPAPGDVVGINRNSFDPETGDTVTIAARAADAAVEVMIYNLSGELVRKLEGTGEVSWDGRSRDGGVAASGVYFLKVTAGGSEEMRRVAVTRGRG